MSDPTPGHRGPGYYKARPQVIQAIQWTGSDECRVEVQAFAGDRVEIVRAPSGDLNVQLLAGPGGMNGWTFVSKDEWIARLPGSDDFWPIEARHFMARYEAIG